VGQLMAMDGRQLEDGIPAASAASLSAIGFRMMQHVVGPEFTRHVGRASMRHAITRSLSFTGTAFFIGFELGFVSFYLRGQ